MAGGTDGDGVRAKKIGKRQTCSQICGIWSADIRNKGQHTYLCNIKCKFKDVNILHKKDAHSMVAAVFVSVHHEYSNSYLTHFHSECACFVLVLNGRIWYFFGIRCEGTGKLTCTHTERARGGGEREKDRHLQAHTRALTSYKHTNGTYMQCRLTLNARKMQKNTKNTKKRA